jgi:hypothetical protein
MRHIIPTVSAVLTAVLTTTVVSMLAGQSSDRQPTPTHACALLSAAKVRNVMGRQDYSAGEEGDAPGEGLGGGSSCGYGLPGDWPPRLAVVLIPARGGVSWTTRRRGVQLYQGCKREQLSGIGDDAFVELSPTEGPDVYAKAGAFDLVVHMNLVPPATAASVKPAVVAVAKAAVAKLR